MSAKAVQKLVLRLSASEIERLRQAALAEGSDADHLADWAKEVLLKSAQSLAEAPKGSGGKATKAPPSRPKCGCGATEKSNGECDNSCIMRF